MDENLRAAAANLIRMALAEDLAGRGDITSTAIAAAAGPCQGVILAKAEGTIAGLEIALMTLAAVDPTLTGLPLIQDGDRVRKGDIVMEVAGDAGRLLVAERTALNFLCRLSGVATLTRRFTDAVAGTRARILDTRKTTPGWRLLEKYAVRCGGGVNHRMGLFDMFLIKDNHIIAAGGIAPAVKRCREYALRMGFYAEIEVETRSLTEVEEALALGVDRIMLDNMDLELMSRAVELAAGRIPLEASGNVTLENVSAIARTGVDFISSGSLTHSARVLDISLDLLPV
ncbi:MAG TPA: carboxylating nicotinate-nucleotide diphosphorylase [bacterium]|nr:carboxylating nicotinate-nucleotide diphosphorylase [bacterium]HOC87926.1 carboxylating nicotinate-nucleotide diphosphorylase [bacterium]HOZ21160.1 carboxylating nicotinate-nucleotide diphosphorylase [bacterium]